MKTRTRTKWKKQKQKKQNVNIVQKKKKKISNISILSKSNPIQSKIHINTYEQQKYKQKQDKQFTKYTKLN